MDASGLRAVLFDWGGVLIEDPAPGLVAYCADALGVAPEDAARVSEPLVDFQSGRIGEAEFWRRVCDELGAESERAGLWAEAFGAVYRPRKEMFALAASVRALGMKTGVLSNTEPPAARFFRSQGYEMFDVLVFSCEIGARKPEERIYRAALGELGFSPAEVLFVDDREEYVAGARAVGMRAAVFEGAEELARALGVGSG